MLSPMAQPATTPATLDRLLDRLEHWGNWGVVATALALGCGAYAWSVAAQIPRPVSAVIGVYALAGGLWLYASLLELHRQRRRSASLPDYEKWNLVATFTFAQAASLWADRRPELEMDDSAYAVYRMLKEQAQSGGLDALPEGPKFHRGSLVLRGDLVSLARRVKQRPRFLFNRHVR